MPERTAGVFLDRDGVLNRAVVTDGIPRGPAGVDDLELLPGVEQACASLHAAGLPLVVVTNQPDIARGRLDPAVVEVQHRVLRGRLPLLDVLVCPHDDADGCACRKPAPGMLLDAAARHGIDPSASVMVGDRWRDVGAGAAAGCRTVFVDHGYDEREVDPDLTVAGLHDAVPWILEVTAEGGCAEMTEIDLSATKIFADGADREGILALRENPVIRGFTTNPTLMRSAGIDDYESFALDLVQLVPDLPISFEVFSDDFDEMERQASKIASWGEHVYVKIPITNTRGESSAELQRRLAGNGVKLNVTALMTVAQVEVAAAALANGPAAFVSVFAGRIADTGRDPIPIMTEALERLAPHPAVELIWASPRELLNIVQAASIGCDVITVTHDVLKKLPTVGKDLDQFSLETVQMFHRDAEHAGYSL